MAECPNSIALFYDNDGYVEPTPQGAQGKPGAAIGLMGRQVAGQTFLDAYLAHGHFRELVAITHNPASTETFLKTCRAHAGMKDTKRVARVVDGQQFLQQFFPSPPAPQIYQSQPLNTRYAWVRQHARPGAYALTGITFTLSTTSVAEQICQMVTGPFERFDSLICISRAGERMVRAVADNYADYLRERHGGTPGLRPRLAVVPLGVDTTQYRLPTPEERADVRGQLGIADDEVAVLFVGRLSFHAKAHPFPMFEGLGQAARTTGRKVRLLLAGWAANPSIMKAFAEGARDFAKGVRVDHVNEERLGSRLAVWRAADIFTSLSDNLQETFGLVLPQAMACGLPVVASEWDGYRDIVVAGETGFLVPTLMVNRATNDTSTRLINSEINYDAFLGCCNQATIVDVRAATEAYARLISDAALRQSMGAAGRKRAEDRFAWVHVIRAYEELWAEQEQERRAFVAAETQPVPFRTPALFPPPEHSFGSFPTAWLDDHDVLVAAPGADSRLGLILAHSLCTYVPEGRSTDRALLGRVLTAAQEPEQLSELEHVMSKTGLARASCRATMAWLLKYDLLRLATAPTPGGE